MDRENTHQKGRGLGVRIIVASGVLVALAALRHMPFPMVIAAWISLADFWISVAFIPVVSLFWKWWQTGFGTSLVALEALIALALFPEALERMFGVNAQTTGFQWFFALLLLMIGGAILWRGWVLWKIQRNGIDEPEGETDGQQRSGN